MKNSNQFKVYAPYAAAIACLLYEAFALAGNSSFISGVACVAILVAGLCCILEKPKVEFIGLISLAVATLFTLFTLIADAVGVLGDIADGAPFAFVIRQILWFITYIIKFVAVAAMAVMSFFYFKKKTNAITKFWYAPAGLVLVYALIYLVFRLLFFFIFNEDMLGFHPEFSVISRYFTTTGLTFLNYLFLTVGFAGIGMHTFTKSKE